MSASRADVLSRPHYVYRAFGRRGRLLYIGCTSNFELRRRDLTRNLRWGHLAATWRLEGPYDYRTARDVELAAIKAEKPAHNATGLVSNNSPAVSYFTKTGRLARRRPVKPRRLA